MTASNFVLGFSTNLTIGLNPDWDPAQNRLNILYPTTDEAMVTMVPTESMDRGVWSYPDISLHKNALSLLDALIPYQIQAGGGGYWCCADWCWRPAWRRLPEYDLAMQSTGVKVDGHMSGGGPSGSDDLKSQVNQRINSQIPPQIEKKLSISFEAVSIFALKNLLFPSGNYITFSSCDVPGDLLLLGSITAD